MDLLLTHGYFLEEDANEKRIMRPYPPLGLLYVSSHLKARGFDVQVFDSTLRTRQELHALVERERPPVAGVYVNLTIRRSALELIRFLKGHGATVVLGGPEPANYPREYLRNGADVVVRGEGELTLEELLPHLARHGLGHLERVRGIAYLDGDGELAETPEREQIADLDAQPFPDREAIDVASYVDVWRRHHGMGSVSLITARGCPYRCRWCSHAVFGFTHRRRSPAGVAAEVEAIVERYRPDMLWYADDVFTIHHRWLFGYAAELARRGLKLPFETISREDRLNEDVVRTLAAMGCRRLWIGAESGSQRILDAMERRTDAGRVVEMVRLLRRYGIEAGMFIMLGYEGEEVADVEATVERLKEAMPDVFLTTLAYPIQGTEYQGRVAARVVSLAPSWEEGSDRLRTVAGRRSRRFYGFANRWLVNEVELAREARRRRPNVLKLARRYVNARVGRAGMRWTRDEIEPAGS
ncbi:MAG TPA: radical SAM protein [Thermoanaerobaculia bacterium]